jgi:hypothetical protein
VNQNATLKGVPTDPARSDVVQPGFGGCYFRWELLTKKGFCLLNEIGFR